MVLGDLTDAKDYHPAELVNRIVREFSKLSEVVDNIYILKGNHDQLKEGSMFFAFLDELPNVKVITRPTEVGDGEALCYFLPYSRNPGTEWASLDFSHYDYLFLHQTVRGAVASNGQEMDGEALPSLNAAKVYSGDIHVPQIAGAVEYVGSPYHVHFGDAFVPRCVAIQRDRRAFDLNFETTRRLSLKLEGRAGIVRLRDVASATTQAKVTVRLSRAEAHEWQAIRREVIEACLASRIELCGLKLEVEKPAGKAGTRPRRCAVDPGEAMYRYVDADGLGGDLLDIGLEIME